MEFPSSQSRRKVRKTKSGNFRYIQVNSKLKQFQFAHSRRPTSHPTVTIFTERIIPIPTYLGENLSCRSFKSPARIVIGNFGNSLEYLEAITTIVHIGSIMGRETEPIIVEVEPLFLIW